MSLDHNMQERDEVEMFRQSLGPEGLALIKEFEGYHKAQPDGSCVAYLCPAGVPTIGWGCTEGVKLGMRWTREEAEAGLLRELAKAQAAVVRLVTVPINQQQFDALVSFTYNVGIGAIQRSTLLRKLNRHDYDGAEREFSRWTRGGGRVLRGLVRRRKREAMLFASGGLVAHEVSHVEEEGMPQAVEVAAAVPVKTLAAAGGTAGGVVVAKSVEQLPAGTWEASTNLAVKMAGFAGSNWTTIAAIGGVMLALLVLPKFTGAKS